MLQNNDFYVFNNSLFYHAPETTLNCLLESFSQSTFTIVFGNTESNSFTGSCSGTVLFIS